TGQRPPVLDAEDVLRDPRGALVALCDVLGIPFTEKMLSWPPGPRSTDGAWAPHWYDAVLASSAFAPWRPRHGTLSPHLRPVLDECAPHYDALRAHRLLG
ncbi:MAG: HAD family hydrolase, partial [Gemmatimonadetes bacterium]|nr:HAD family hydrolase [Gemmatimonadota bacterium]